MDRLYYFFTEKPVFLVGLLFAGLIFLVVLFVGAAEQGRESFQRRAVENMMITGNQATAAATPQTARNQTSSRQRATTGTSGSVAATTSYSEPMVVKAVAMVDPEHTCVDSGTKVSIPGMQLTANDSHRTASYRWKVDILSGLDYSTREEWRGRVPGGETNYIVSYEGSEVLYSRTFTHPHDEIRMRLRIVSPNDVTSDWYVVPASKTCR